jgi:uncharacterized membrane protein
MPEVHDIQGLARRRIIVGTTAGAIAAGVAAVIGATWSVAVLVGWDTLTLIFVVLVWRTILTRDAEATERLALAEDDSRTAADAIILGASLASLVAIVFTLAQAAKASGSDAVLLAALAVIASCLAGPRSRPRSRLCTRASTTGHREAGSISRTVNPTIATSHTQRSRSA